MGRLFNHVFIKLILVIILFALLIPCGCGNDNDEGFAIYSPKEDISPSQMPILSHVDIAEQPILSLDDIISYDAVTHEITLTETAFNRISGMTVPTSGKSFVVCVDRNPVYWGAFWTMLSSQSFGGITIFLPLLTEDTHTIKIELGYPSSSFYTGEDPRNNEDVMKSLEEAGKLTRSSTVDMLPRSLKGYELYSWPEGEQWHFTLITGTNRNKTLEEIISTEDTTSGDGLIRIHVTGVEAIKAVLSRVPQNEYVTWWSSLHAAETTPEIDVNISLPSESIINTIKEYAGQCGLNFFVQSY